MHVSQLCVKEGRCKTSKSKEAGDGRQLLAKLHVTRSNGTDDFDPTVMEIPACQRARTLNRKSGAAPKLLRQMALSYSAGTMKVVSETIFP
jgi:hypothetical protein